MSSALFGLQNAIYSFYAGDANSFSGWHLGTCLSNYGVFIMSFWICGIISFEIFEYGDDFCPHRELGCRSPLGSLFGGCQR